MGDIWYPVEALELEDIGYACRTDLRKPSLIRETNLVKKLILGETIFEKFLIDRKMFLNLNGFRTLRLTEEVKNSESYRLHIPHLA